MIMTNSLATTMIVINIRMSMIRVINLHRFDCVSEVCVYVGRKTRREGWWVGMKEGGRKRIGELGGRKEKKGRKGGMEGVKRGRRQREKKIHKDINVESWNVVVVKC